MREKKIDKKKINAQNSKKNDQNYLKAMETLEKFQKDHANFNVMQIDPKHIVSNYYNN